LPDCQDGGLAATLTLNDSGKFEDRWVNLCVTSDKCLFLRGIERMYLPVAHAEGKFVPRDEATLQTLEANGQIVLRYGRLDGSSGEVPYPDCPNGAVGAIAGVCDPTGRVFGLMPHPERFIDPTQHPRWTREPERDRGDGWRVFTNAVEYFT
jgi:phosphoribosylformylglycinamidine synthase